MRSFRAWCLILALVLLPVTARAEGQTATLSEYRAMLQQVVQQLESAERSAIGDPAGAEAAVAAARQLTGTTWRVETPGGPVSADLRPLAELLGEADPKTTTGRDSLSQALALAREHLSAAEAVSQSTFEKDTEARKRLDRALAQAESRKKLLDRIFEWLSRLFSRGEKVAEPVGEAVSNKPLQWITLAVAAAGLALLARGLVRSLSGQTGSVDTAVRQGRSKADRPLTPEEMRQEARHCAAAGDYKEALRLAHLALLQHFDRERLIRYVPAQTNREHERQLRRKYPALAAGLHRLNDLIEVRLYAGHGATADDFTIADDQIDRLWREGDAASKSANATTGASSSA